MPDNSQSYLSEKALQVNSPIPAPDIAINPQDASFPLRVDPFDGQIRPSYQNEICVKRFVICVKWEKRTLFFPDLTWFMHNGFELRKMEKP